MPSGKGEARSAIGIAAGGSLSMNGCTAAQVASFWFGDDGVSSTITSNRASSPKPNLAGIEFRRRAWSATLNVGARRLGLRAANPVEVAVLADRLAAACCMVYETNCVTGRLLDPSGHLLLEFGLRHLRIDEHADQHARGQQLQLLEHGFALELAVIPEPVEQRSRGSSWPIGAADIRGSPAGSRSACPSISTLAPVKERRRLRSATRWQLEACRALADPRRSR